MKISKILSYVVLAVGVLGALLLFVMNSNFDTLLADNGVSDARELPLEPASAAVSPLYGLTMLIFALVVIVTLISVFSALAKNPKGLKKTLIGIGIFVVVLGISYAMATGIETPMKDGEVLSSNGSKWVGAGLNAFYILALLAVGSMVVSGVKKITTSN